jgi:hypothetical protein
MEIDFPRISRWRVGVLVLMLIATVMTPVIVRTDTAGAQTTTRQVPEMMPVAWQDSLAVTVNIEPVTPQTVFAPAAMPDSAAAAGLAPLPVTMSAFTCMAIVIVELGRPLGAYDYHNCVTAAESTLALAGWTQMNVDGFLSEAEAGVIGTHFNVACLGIADARLRAETFEALAGLRPCTNGVTAIETFPHIVAISDANLGYVNTGWEGAVPHHSVAVSEFLIRYMFESKGMAGIAVCTSSHESGMQNWRVSFDVTYFGLFQIEPFLHANGAIAEARLVPFDVGDPGYNVIVTWLMVRYQLNEFGKYWPVGVWGGAAGC